jgi:hypothetical protein
MTITSAHPCMLNGLGVSKAHFRLPTCAIGQFFSARESLEMLRADKAVPHLYLYRYRVDVGDCRYQRPLSVLGKSVPVG